MQIELFFEKILIKTANNYFLTKTEFSLSLSFEKAVLCKCLMIKLVKDDMHM